VLISHQVNIHDTNGHPLSAAMRHRHFVEIVRHGHPPDWTDMDARPIRIGDDCWIGFGATILKGVAIGQGAVVAARALVTSDVAPWTVVAGNPAVPIKELVHE
jgi:acetyltransferase-like isoleucine patch superfamily enzyme